MHGEESLWMKTMVSAGENLLSEAEQERFLQSNNGSVSSLTLQPRTLSSDG
jgi:hypothetical protein